MKNEAIKNYSKQLWTSYKKTKCKKFLIYETMLNLTRKIQIQTKNTILYISKCEWVKSLVIQHVDENVACYKHQLVQPVRGQCGRGHQSHKCTYHLTYKLHCQEFIFSDIFTCVKGHLHCSSGCGNKWKSETRGLPLTEEWFCKPWYGSAMKYSLTMKKKTPWHGKYF